MNFSNLVKLAMAEFSLYIEDFKSTSLVRLIIKLFNFEGTKICVYALFIPWKKKMVGVRDSNAGNASYLLQILAGGDDSEATGEP